MLPGKLMSGQWRVTLSGGRLGSPQVRTPFISRGVGVKVGRSSATWLLALAWVIAVPCAPLRACTEPVFRYALQAWVPDRYQAVVYYREPLADEHQEALQGLRRMASSRGALANLVVTTVALNADEAPPTPLPAPAGIALSYPASVGIDGLAWSGPLDVASVSALMHSPARQELGRHLLTGKAIVWLLLESGDERKDKAAAEVLGAALAATEGHSLADGGSNERWEGPGELEETPDSTGMQTLPPPALHLLRVSRSDPAERAFVAMLLNSAPRLPERTDEPMAFPVFGRGRALDVLVGQEIDAEVIGEVNAFLRGPCSCVVKAQNPGLDLLMAVDWEAAMAEAASESQVSLALADSRTSAGVAYETDRLPGSDADSSPSGALVRNTALVLGAFAVVAAAATIALPYWLRRRAR